MVLDKRYIEPSPIETNHQIGHAEVFGSAVEGRGIIEIGTIFSFIPDAEDTNPSFAPNAVPRPPAFVEALGDF